MPPGSGPLESSALLDVEVDEAVVRRREREHARQADALFDGGLDSETFRQRAIASGVRYLVIAKWDWIGWERWLTTPGFPVATLYDDDRYLVLRIS